MGSIDIGAMQEVVAGFPAAKLSLTELKEALHTMWDLANKSTRTAHLASVEWQRVDSVLQWLDTQQPRMQWRLDLGLALAAAQSPTFNVNGAYAPGQCTVDNVDDSLVDKLKTIIDGAQSGHLTDAEWDMLVSVASGPYAGWFGSELFNHLSAQDLAKLALGLSEPFKLPSAGAGQRGGVWYPPDPAAYTTYGHRLEALGGLLGAASQSRCPALPASYADDIISVFKVPASRGPYAVMMSILLSYGTYEEGFALHISEGVYDYVTSDGFPGWCRTGLAADRVALPNGTFIDDAMPGVMSMLASNPDAAQRFFTSDSAWQCRIEDDTVTIKIDGQDVKVNARLAFLLTQYDWSRGPAGLSDNGDALGKALEVATTWYRNRDQTGQTSAIIATDVFAILGQSQSQSDSMPEMMKNHIASIAADYMPDFIRAANSDAANPDLSRFSKAAFYDGNYDAMFPPGMPWGMLVTVSELENLFHGLGRGPNALDNLAIVTGGWAAADQLRAAYRAQQNAGDWQASVKDDTSVLKLIIENGLSGGDADEEERKKQAAWINLIIAWVGAIPALKAPIAALEVPEAIKELGGYLWDQAKKYAQDQAKAAITAGLSYSTKDKLSDLQSAAARQCAVVWLQAMLDNNQNYQWLSQEAINNGLADVDDTGRPVEPVLKEDPPGSGHYTLNPNSVLFVPWVENNSTNWPAIQDAILRGLDWPK